MDCVAWESGTNLGGIELGLRDGYLCRVYYINVGKNYGGPGVLPEASMTSVH